MLLSIDYFLTPAALQVTGLLFFSNQVRVQLCTGGKCAQVNNVSQPDINQASGYDGEKKKTGGGNGARGKPVFLHSPCW